MIGQIPPEGELDGLRSTEVGIVVIVVVNLRPYCEGKKKETGVAFHSFVPKFCSEAQSLRDASGNILQNTALLLLGLVRPPLSLPTPPSFHSLFRVRSYVPPSSLLPFLPSVRAL